MGSKLYVGNLSYDTTNSDLEQLLGQHGTVRTAEVIQDRDTGRSKGFGFVQMGSDDDARTAIAALHGQPHDGRNLTVNEAKPKENRSGGGGGGDGGGHRGFGGSGNRGGGQRY
jgi:RNA recognition motif-containing protein